MKLARLMLGVVCWVPMTVVAQDRPAPTVPSAAQRAAYAERYGAVFQGPRRPTDAEVEEVSQFLREYSPNRWRALESLPEEGRERRAVMAFAVARWRGIQELKEAEPALYDLKLKQLKVEDDIYGLLAVKLPPAEREPLRPKVRESVEQLVNLRMAERELRVESLRKQLKEEEERLASDKARVDKMVDRRTDTLMQEGPGALRLGLGRGNQPPRTPPAHPPTTRPAE